MRCCVVLPVYNEAVNLGQLIPEIFAQGKRFPGDELWVVVVDDDSEDGSEAILASLQTRYPNLRVVRGRRRGLGVAYQRGFRYAVAELRPDWLVEMDGDRQHDPAALPSLLQACLGGAEVAIGSRFAPGGTTPAFSARRRWTSQAGNWLIHRVAGVPLLHDYTSGYRCLDARVGMQALDQCSRDGLAVRGYAFQSSLITEILLGGARVTEVPIVFGTRVHGRSKLGWRDYLEFLLNLRKLRTRCGHATRGQAAPAGR